MRRVSASPMAETYQRKQAATAWLFVTPFAVIFLVFTALPALMALLFSMTDIGARDVRDPLAVDFVFLETFGHVLTSPDFLRSMGNTGVMVIVGVPATMIIGLVLALALNNGIRRLRSLYRAAFYLPVITNIVAAAVIFQYGLTLNGPLNSALADVGVVGVNWLGEPAAAMGSVIYMGVWRQAGTCMVLFLAGLQAIPEELYEASALDGASAWQRFVHITLPMLQPATLLVTVLMTVSFMNIFDEPYLLTEGGPLGSTRSMALWVYEQFGFGNIASAMAGSYVLLAIVVVLGVVQLRMLRPKT